MGQQSGERVIFRAESGDYEITKNAGDSGKGSSGGKKPPSKKKKTVINICIAAFSLLFLFSAWQLISILVEYKAGKDEYRSVTERAVTPAPSTPGNPDIGPEAAPTVDPDGFLQVDYAALTEINDDYIGWLQVPGTAIHYPMVFPPDNDYYLRRTFLGSYNVAGSIFLDYRTGSDFDAGSVIIYGHRMNDGSMFADIKKFFDPAFFEEHREIRIYTEREILCYEVFSAREVTVNDACFTFGFADADSYVQWLAAMQAASPYSSDFPLSADTRTITLSTCVYNKEDSRNILQAWLAERIPLGAAAA